jgi:hypothetical protein
MNYTDYQRQVVKLLNSAWDTTPPEISALPDGGTRVKYTLKQQLQDAPITFAMDYRLHDGYFDVTVPQDQLKESIDDSKQAGFYVVTIEPLPFFGSGADDEQGYMLLPKSGCCCRRSGSPSKPTRPPGPPPAPSWAWSPRATPTS